MTHPQMPPQIKIAFLFPDCLTPVNSGAKALSSSILEYFRSQGIHVTLITPFLHKPNTKSVNQYSDQLIEIPSVLRAPWWRLLNRISNMGRKHAFSRDTLFRRLMRRRISKALHSTNFDAIVLNYVQFSEWVPPDLKSRTIVLTHDIYHRRWASLTRKSFDHASVAMVKNIEYRELAKYPLLLTVADYEYEELSKEFPIGNLLDIGAPQVVRSCSNNEPTYRFGFVGANALPNCDGLINFLKEWWPSLKPSSLGIAGSVCNNREVFKEVTMVGGTLEGFVDNIDDFYSNCRWILAPLRIGSGIKVKVLEAMARGKVVIGTRKAFEGIPVIHGVNALILENLNSPARLSDTILSIEQNPIELEKMEKHALQLVQRHFALESRLGTLVERIKKGSPFANLGP